MNISAYLMGLVLVVFLASACLAAILVYFNPSSSGVHIFTLFYLSLFTSTTGVFTLIGFLIRQFSRKKRFSMPEGQAIRNLEISFRQGLLLSVILIALLALQSQRILSWWHIVALVGLVGLAEWWLMKRDN